MDKMNLDDMKNEVGLGLVSLSYQMKSEEINNPLDIKTETADMEDENGLEDSDYEEYETIEKIREELASLSKHKQNYNLYDGRSSASEKEENEIVEEDPIYNCFLCACIFHTERDVSIHTLTVHADGKLFDCDDCGYSSGLINNLSKFVEPVHKKVKPFKCSECENSFTSRSDLVIHICSVHKNLEPFGSLECEPSITLNYNLINDIDGPINKKLKSFICPECERPFTQNSSLSRHIKSIHKKLKPYQCTECNRSFSQSSILSRHNISVHKKLKPHKCTECEKSYSLKGNLESHFRSCHSNVKRWPKMFLNAVDEAPFCKNTSFLDMNLLDHFSGN